MQKALFLDRDGVINIERAYAHCREDFEFQDGIFDLCSAAESLGYLLFVVTNQAGIARGYYSEEQFLDLTRWMVNEFARRHVHIRKVYYCPFHPKHGIGRYKLDSPERKPGPGMLLSAQTQFDLNMQDSVLIGDQITDIRAAEAAGVGTRIWLNSLHAGSDIDVSYDTAYSLHEIQVRFFSGRTEILGGIHK
jgi:D-glycero-D-manno-heptose 1,7-bisphosphate phosphatase